MSEIMDKKMFYLLILKNELEKMNININDIESIEIVNDNAEIKLKDAMRTVDINLEVK